jgi:hypothetical protein
MTVYSEGNYLGDLLKWELENRHSREKVTLLSGESVVLGEVVGKVTKVTPTTGTKDATNTGAGTCTVVTAGDKAVVGTYTLECTAAADSSAGTDAIFKVINPEGFALPDAEAGTAYTNEQINFTITSAGAAFIVGDSFTIAITAGSGKVVPIDFDAVDGSQDAYGFMTAACDATSADEDGTAVVRDAQIVADYLTWPDGASTAQKAAALAQLAVKGIVEREEA